MVVCTHTGVCTRVNVYTYVSVCMSGCVHIRVCTALCTYICVHGHNTCEHVCVHVCERGHECVSVNTHTCVHVGTRTCARVCVYTHVCMCTCMCARAHTLVAVSVCVHVCKHALVHLYVLVCVVCVLRQGAGRSSRPSPSADPGVLDSRAPSWLEGVLWVRNVGGGGLVPPSGCECFFWGLSSARGHQNPQRHVLIRAERGGRLAHEQSPRRAVPASCCEHAGLRGRAMCSEPWGQGGLPQRPETPSSSPCSFFTDNVLKAVLGSQQN